MKLSQFNNRSILLTIALSAMMLTIQAQENKRISFQVAPLYSFLKADFGKNNQFIYEGIENPKLGWSSAVKFEVDITDQLALSTGLSYDMRKNSYQTNLYDTVADGDLSFLLPYQFTSNANYHFVGIPVALQVNYINNAKFRIYQSFGTHFSFLVSSRFKVVQFWQGKSNVHYSKNGSPDDKNNVIVSVFSSIAICRNITKRMAFKIEPGISYMANNFWDNAFAKEKFMDLKIDAGIVYQLQVKKD